MVFRTTLIFVLVISWAAPVSAQDMSSSHPTKIIFLGDTSFGESYQDARASKGFEPILRTRGYDYMIARFAKILGNADFIIANLETPVTETFPSPLAGQKSYIHYADIEQTPRTLGKYGINLVSLANNHSMDYGVRGLRDTLQSLKDHGIETCGAGEDSRVAGHAFVKSFALKGHDLNLAVLCMFEYQGSYATKYEFYAEPARAGVTPLSVNTIQLAIDAVRKENEDTFIVAFPHWGKNYAWASDAQVEAAHQMIDNGVDLVIGHGAHLLQEIERYNDRWIIYSIGNFVFGSPGRYRKSEMLPYSAIASLLISPGPNGASQKLRLHPIFTDNRLTDYQSRFVTGAEFNDVLTQLRGQSRSEDSFERLFEFGTDDYGHFLEINLQQ